MPFYIVSTLCSDSQIIKVALKLKTCTGTGNQRISDGIVINTILSVSISICEKASFLFTGHMF